jgi:hypothetical protein
VRCPRDERCMNIPTASIQNIPPLWCALYVINPTQV